MIGLDRRIGRVVFELVEPDFRPRRDEFEVDRVVEKAHVEHAFDIFFYGRNVRHHATPNCCPNFQTPFLPLRQQAVQPGAVRKSSRSMAMPLLARACDANSGAVFGRFLESAIRCGYQGAMSRVAVPILVGCAWPRCAQTGVRAGRACRPARRADRQARGRQRRARASRSPRHPDREPRQCRAPCTRQLRPDADPSRHRARRRLFGRRPRACSIPTPI